MTAAVLAVGSVPRMLQQLLHRRSIGACRLSVQRRRNYRQERLHPATASQLSGCLFGLCAGMALAALFVTMPFVVRELLPILEQMDMAEEEAAR